MSDSSDTTAGTLSPGKKMAETFRTLLSYPLPFAGIVIIVLLVLMSVFAPLIAPYDPHDQDLYNVLTPPSALHWLGTDEIGRDLLSRLLYGGRVSLVFGVAATFMSAVIGISAGLLAGLRGGIADQIIMRIVDAIFCFPALLLVLGLAAALGGGLQNVAIAIVLFGWAVFARLVRGQVLLVRELPYIEACHAAGTGGFRTAVRHVLPNTLAPVIVLISLSVAGNIGLEASVSFLGLGVQPPTASWGAELRAGFNYLESAPFYSIIPGLLITAAVLAFNFLGDGLRDVLDPRLRGEGAE